jgi:hypothetical protein
LQYSGGGGLGQASAQQEEQGDKARHHAVLHGEVWV